MFVLCVVKMKARKLKNQAFEFWKAFKRAEGKMAFVIFFSGLSLPRTSPADEKYGFYRDLENPRRVPLFCK